MGFISAHSSWRYVAGRELPRTGPILADLSDMRLALTFTLADCHLTAIHFGDAVQGLRVEGAA